MFGFAMRRFAQAVPLLLGVTVLIFVILQMTPGGPLATGESGSVRMSAADIERLRGMYGLDDPVPVQYLHWVGGIVTGDWGMSFATDRPVLEMIGERLPVTITLTVSAFVLSCLIAIPLGVVAALRRNRPADHVITGMSFVGLATPSFWFALMLIFVFSHSLNWLPAYGLEDLRANYQGFDAVIDQVRHLIMPVAAVTLVSASNLTRYVRAAMIDVLSEDYIRTARGAGLPRRTVIFRHASKNAALPVVTVALLTIPELFLGTIIVETIFALPGMGRLFMDASADRDYPVLMGILLVGALLFVTANLIADMLYGWLDPRIQHG